MVFYLMHYLECTCKYFMINMATTNTVELFFASQPFDIKIVSLYMLHFDVSQKAEKQ